MEEPLDKLNELKKEQILNILSKVMEKDEAFKIKLQNSVDSRFNQLTRQNEIDDDLGKYQELWDEAERIIDDLNEYGGGSEEDEITASDNLHNIVELFKKGNLSLDLKREFIKNCIHFYYLGNSGMDDDLINTSYSVCENKEDWLFLIEKLKKIDRDYTNNRIMDIYRDQLADDKTYLEMRLNKLHYGMDYYDLVKFYDTKGEKQTAFETALEGLKKGEGRIIDLIKYLQKYYENKKDHVNTLKYHILIFKEEPSLDSYKKIRNFCIDDEWKNVSKELYGLILDKEYVKRQIDFENKEYKKVFESITKTEYSFDDEWARMLEPVFPDDFIKIYKQKIKKNIEYKNVKNYYIAVCYCFRVKNILQTILNKHQDWDVYLNSLKENYPKLPAFQRELRQLDDIQEEDE